ncbi:hypothetical protein Adt_02757 [Abeliophyllum distichum]|uniref:Uncharacterized protein n=1 Tax=Abeliophyllum distichum TaxID=126358 RepID=A0ABD1VWJ6_9LAMI
MLICSVQLEEVGVKVTLIASLFYPQASPFSSVITFSLPCRLTLFDKSESSLERTENEVPMAGSDDKEAVTIETDPTSRTGDDKFLSLKPLESQMSEVLSNENLRRVHIGSPEDMDNFDLGGVMDVAGFSHDVAEDITLSPLNKKKRRTDKGKATVETTVVPHSASRVTRGSDTRAYKEFGFPPVDSTVEAEIMLGCVNEKLIENLKNKEAAAMRRIMYTNHRRRCSLCWTRVAAESKKKDNENARLQKEVDQLRKKLETADDEAIARYKMSAEYKGNLHMYGAESLKAAIKMTKEWLVDDHSEIDPEEFDRYLRKRRAADLAAQKAKVTNHGGVGSQPAGSLDN